MWWSFSRALLCAFLVSPVLGVPPAEKAGRTKESKQVALQADGAPAAGVKDSKDAADESTYFNGQKVPPITMLDGGKLQDEIKDGYW